MTFHAPILSQDDRREMLWRALDVCPDLGCDDTVVDHLHRLGFHLTGDEAIDADLWEMIDEARTSKLNMRDG